MNLGCYFRPGRIYDMWSSLYADVSSGLFKGREPVLWQGE